MGTEAASPYETPALRVSHRAGRRNKFVAPAALPSQLQIGIKRTCRCPLQLGFRTLVQFGFSSRGADGAVLEVPRRSTRREKIRNVPEHGSPLYHL